MKLFINFFFLLYYVLKKLKLFKLKSVETIGKMCMFHSLANLQTIKRSVKLFFIKRWVFGPCWMYKKLYHLWAYFDHEPNVDLSPNMYFRAHISHHAYFLLFHWNNIYTKKLNCPTINLLPTYTFVDMIIFWMSIYLSFQSHQMCTLSEG